MNNGAKLWILKETVTGLYRNECSFKKLFQISVYMLSVLVARQLVNPSCSKTCLRARLGDCGKMKPDSCTYMTEELITPQHLPVLQSISFFISDHLQCLFLPLDVSAVGLNGFGIMDFFMHPFVKSDTLLAVHNCHKSVYFPQYRLSPLRLFLHQSSHLLDENTFFYISLFSSSALTLKWALIMGQKIWKLGCFMYPMHIFYIFLSKTASFFDSFSSIWSSWAQLLKLTLMTTQLRLAWISLPLWNGIPKVS